MTPSSSPSPTEIADTGVFSLVWWLSVLAAGAAGAILRSFHPVHMLRSGLLKRRAKKLVERHERFLKERDEAIPHVTATQDSPGWRGQRQHKQGYIDDTMRQCRENYFPELLAFSEEMKREGARVSFDPARPGNTKVAREFVEQLRKIGKMKRLVR